MTVVVVPTDVVVGASVVVVEDVAGGSGANSEVDVDEAMVVELEGAETDVPPLHAAEMAALAATTATRRAIR